MQNRITLGLLFLSFLFIQIGNAQEKKFFNANEVGVIVYGPLLPEIGYGIRTVNGYVFKQRLHVGIGVAYEKYVLDEDDNLKALPLFLHTKYMLYPERKASLYGALDAGYGFAFVNKKIKDENQQMSFKGGFMYSPQIGLRILSKNRKSNWTIALGYKYQQLQKDHYYNITLLEDVGSNPHKDYDLFETKKYDLHRFSVMLGFGF